ncbi:MAG: hypothetical protein KAU20_07950 [Nanoarchaeota archaeon]|nr:hypothetical protein [Nanoarchaeota archaeon]
MEYKLILGLIILSILSAIVFASDAPPPIPTEYWGRLMIDGEPAPDGTPVSYFNGDKWINTTTIDGWYNLIMTGGDSPLTYNDDSNCSQHEANGTACIPCTQDFDCVEGPQEGDTVNITVNNTPVSITWGENVSTEENVIVSIPLYTGWNMISLPILKTNNSPASVMSHLTGDRTAYYYDASDVGDHWKGYDSTTPEFTWDLDNMEPNKGYWLKVESAQTLSVAGNVPSNNTMSLYTGWNMVSFQLYNNTIQNTMNKLTGDRTAYYYDASDVGDHWKGYDSTTPEFTWDLNEVNIGKGYWVKVDSDQNWVK